MFEALFSHPVTKAAMKDITNVVATFFEIVIWKFQEIEWAFCRLIPACARNTIEAYHKSPLSTGSSPHAWGTLHRRIRYISQSSRAIGPYSLMILSISGPSSCPPRRPDRACPAHKTVPPCPTPSPAHAGSIPQPPRPEPNGQSAHRITKIGRASCRERV